MERATEFVKLTIVQNHIAVFIFSLYYILCVCVCYCITCMRRCITTTGLRLKKRKKNNVLCTGKKKKGLSDCRQLWLDPNAVVASGTRWRRFRTLSYMVRKLKAIILHFNVEISVRLRQLTLFVSMSICGFHGPSFCFNCIFQKSPSNVRISYRQVSKLQHLISTSSAIFRQSLCIRRYAVHFTTQKTQFVFNSFSR